MKFKNYVNSLTGDNRIFSNKDIADMTVKEAFGRQDEILAQHNQIGIPSEKELQSSDNVVYVNAYTREDGTEVKAHWRSKPDRIQSNNLSEQNKSTQSGTPTGGASSLQKNYEERVKPTKKDYLQGMFNDYKSLKDPTDTAAYVLGEFLTNYSNMKDADTKKADKYFHAKANYEAAQQGIVGSVVAKLISDIRELTDSYRNIHEKGYTPEFSKKDSEEDQEANREGRRLGRKYPTAPPFEVLEHLKPNGLPKRYQKKW